MVGFHLSGYRTFKHDCLNYVLRYQRGYFPGLVRYQRFVELLQGCQVPLCCFLTSRSGRCCRISFIDSTKISVCHNCRIGSHKVMLEFTAWGKISVDWFYGFKFHLVVIDEGELLAVKITVGNVDDRDPVPELTRSLFGKFMVTEATFRSYSLSNACSSSLRYARIWKTSCCHCLTSCCYVSARSFRPSRPIEEYVANRASPPSQPS
jgi:hypothetical protein